MEKRIWTLWFVREPTDGPDVEKLLGVYSTEELANAARERAALVPGFNETPDDTLLVVDEPLDWVGWTSGFARVNY